MLCKYNVVAGKVSTVAKTKRNIWDELAEIGRRIVNEIDDILVPKPKRKPARVPVPVRNNPHPRNPYDQD